MPSISKERKLIRTELLNNKVVTLSRNKASKTIKIAYDVDMDWFDIEETFHGKSNIRYVIPNDIDNFLSLYLEDGYSDIQIEKRQ